MPDDLAIAGYCGMAEEISCGGFTLPPTFTRVTGCGGGATSASDAIR